MKRAGPTMITGGLTFAEVTGSGAEISAVRTQAPRVYPGSRRNPYDGLVNYCNRVYFINSNYLWELTSSTPYADPDGIVGQAHGMACIPEAPVYVPPAYVPPVYVPPGTVPPPAVVAPPKVEAPKPRTTTARGCRGCRTPGAIVAGVVDAPITGRTVPQLRMPIVSPGPVGPQLPPAPAICWPCILAALLAGMLIVSSD